MKKLMTMIAAVATAFGLYAAEPSITDNAVNFSGFTDANPWTLTDKDGQTDALWAYTDGAPATNEAQIASGNLVLKTGTKVLTRKFASDVVTVDDDLGLFADVTLNFQSQALDSDSIPTAADLNGAKLALFLLDTSDADGAAVKGTNLYAVAGYGSTRALYQLGAVIDDAFMQNSHTFTIKFYNQALNNVTRPGFLIFMDQEVAGEGEGSALQAKFRYDLKDDGTFDLANRITCSAGYLGDVVVKSSLLGWYNKQRLLLSLMDIGDQTFTGVDFKGNASIASVKLTDDKENFPFVPGDAKAISVDATTLATPLAASNFVFDPTTGASFANGVITVFDDATQITVTPTFTKEIHTITIGSKEGTDSLTFTIEDGATLTVREADAAAYVTVDGGDPEPVESLEDAIGAVNGASEKGELVLAQPVVLATGEQISFAGLDVVLDLNGKTITGAGDGDNATVIYNTGKLLITDTSDGQNGSVVSIALDDAVAVKNGEEATLAIDAGKFVGAIADANELAATTLTGGTYDKANNEQTTLEGFLPEGDTHEVVEDGELYWKVQVAAPKTYTVTVDPAIENGKISVDKDEAEKDETVTVTATPDTGYELEDVTAELEDGTQVSVSVDFDENSATFEMPAGNVTVSATFAAIEIDVKVNLGEHVSAVVSNMTQNIEIGTATETTTFNEAAIISDVIVAYYTADEGYHPLSSTVSTDVNASDVEAGVVELTKITALANKYYVQTYTNGVEYVQENYFFGDQAISLTEPVLDPETEEWDGKWYTDETYTTQWTFDGSVAGNSQKAYAKITEKQGAPDPADDDPAKIDPSETAAKRYGDRVPAKLADVSAKELCTWATTVGDLETGDEIKVEAFLFNIANASDEAAVKAEKDHFAFTSITAGVKPEAGKDIPNTNVAGAAYNGTVLVGAFADAACTIPQMSGAEADTFYKATLNPTPAPAPAE